jgi:hypothetical protein
VVKDAKLAMVNVPKPKEFKKKKKKIKKIIIIIKIIFIKVQGR